MSRAIGFAAAGTRPAFGLAERRLVTRDVYQPAATVSFG